MKALQVRISGVVQGVGYRYWTEQHAKARGLNGWVRNRRDGSVEAIIAGDDAAVDDMLAAFWQGPASSDVDGVTSEVVDAAVVEAGFRTLPTA